VVLQKQNNDDECYLLSFCYGFVRGKKWWKVLFVVILLWSCKQEKQWRALFIIIMLWYFRNEWTTMNDYVSHHWSILVLQEWKNDDEPHNYPSSFCYGLASNKKTTRSNVAAHHCFDVVL
jgi:hypothetical protein